MNVIQKKSERNNNDFVQINSQDEQLTRLAIMKGKYTSGGETETEIVVVPSPPFILV